MSIWVSMWLPCDFAGIHNGGPGQISPSSSEASKPRKAFIPSTRRGAASASPRGGTAELTTKSSCYFIRNNLWIEPLKLNVQCWNAFDEGCGLFFFGLVSFETGPSKIASFAVCQALKYDFFRQTCWDIRYFCPIINYHGLNHKPQ